MPETLFKPNHLFFRQFEDATVCKDTVISSVNDIKPLFSKSKIDSKKCQKEKIDHWVIRFTGEEDCLQQWVPGRALMKRNILLL